MTRTRTGGFSLIEAIRFKKIENSLDMML